MVDGVFEAVVMKLAGGACVVGVIQIQIFISAVFFFSFLFLVLTCCKPPKQVAN